MRNMTSEMPEVSVVVPISERHDDITKLYQVYSDELIDMKRSFEFLFIIDGDFKVAYDDLKRLREDGHPVRIVKFSKNFGESMALMEGFNLAKGSNILTLASYFQVEPKDLKKVFDTFDQGNDMVITRRYPRQDPLVNRLQSSVYHFLVRKMTSAPFKDITSGMRLIKRKILDEIVLYGDLHRFLPVLALQKGFKVQEVNVGHRKEDTELRLVKPGIYIRRLLDILTLFFLVKFTKKPLRFFGLIGSFLATIGFAITSVLGVKRLMGLTPLADRPLLLLGIMLMVFGVQILSVGLVGELILFTHAEDISDYTIEKIIE